MYKRLLAALICVPVCLGLLCGCSFNQVTIEYEAETEAATQPTTAPVVITPPTTEATTEATTAPTEPQLAPWKTAYLNTIKEEYDFSYITFRLVYVDSDSIPELFIDTGAEAGGSRVYTYRNGSVDNVYLNRCGGAYYIPYSGLVYNCNGNMGYYYTSVYRLSGGSFANLLGGLEIHEYSYFTNEEGEEEYTEVVTYSIGEQELTEEEFNAQVAAVFDLSSAFPLKSNMQSYSAIQQTIRNW